MIQLKLCFLPLMMLSVTTVSSVDIIESNAKKNPLLTINAGDGGKFSNGSNVKTVTVRNGITWGEYKNNMPTPTKSGYDIEKWTFDADPKSVAITDDYVFTADTTIYAIWGAGEVKHFATDSWATIVNLANRGLSAIKEAYAEDIAIYGDTFVITNVNNEDEVKTKTRKLELPGIGTYNVRVIGEAIDKIDGKNEVATLTFEFEELISPSVSYDNFTRKENNWENSDIRYFLNNSFYSRLPSVVRDNLKTVEKDTGIAQGMVDTTSEKVFIPSLYELGLSSVNESSLSTETKDENVIYPFYMKNNSDTTRKKYYVNPNTSNKEYLSYWTRSPFDNCTDKAHIIDKDGVAIESDDNSVTRGNGIAPCFAIGSTVANVVNINAGDHITGVRYPKYTSNDSNLIVHFKLEDGFQLPSSDYVEGNTDLVIKVNDVVLSNKTEPFKYYSNQDNNYIEVYSGYMDGTVVIDVKGIAKS